MNMPSSFNNKQSLWQKLKNKRINRSYLFTVLALVVALVVIIAAAIAYIYEARRFLKVSAACKHPKRAVAILCIIAALFILFTFITPEIGIFKDPLTGMYGI